MATRTVSRNNLIAGAFVLGGIVLAVVMSIVISGAQERMIATTNYIIRFSLVEGTSGLKQGSSVLLAGQPVGRVTEVRFYRPAGPGQPPAGVDILVKIRSDVVLFEDAWAFLERPLLGNMSAINIAQAGDGTQVESPQGNSPLLQEGEVLPGIIAPPAFLAQAGYGPEQVRQFKLMVAQASEAVERINRMTQKVEDEIDPTLEGIRTAVTDFNAVTADIREHTPEWTGRVDAILASTQDSVDALKRAIEENRPAIDRFVASIDEAAARVNAESVPLLNDTLSGARAGADEFTQAGRSVNTLLQEQLPNVRRILANLRLAADQAKLTMVEVRRNPWRLFYQPTTKELESELFYSAARTYAEAVSDLRAASESLEVIGRLPTGSVDQAEAQRLNRRLQEAFDRYRTAEQRLLDEMIQKRD